MARRPKTPLEQEINKKARQNPKVRKVNKKRREVSKKIRKKTEGVRKQPRPKTPADEAYNQRRRVIRETKRLQKSLSDKSITPLERRTIERKIDQNREDIANSYSTFAPEEQRQLVFRSWAERFTAGVKAGERAVKSQHVTTPSHIPNASQRARNAAFEEQVRIALQWDPIKRPQESTLDEDPEIARLKAIAFFHAHLHERRVNPEHPWSEIMKVHNTDSLIDAYLQTMDNMKDSWDQIISDFESGGDSWQVRYEAVRDFLQAAAYHSMRYDA